MRSAEVVVIGAGVMGASIAWHLASRGMTDVLVIDREASPGNGSTGKATGGFRAQFATEVNIRLSLLSRTKLQRFREETGGDAGYSPCGYLFLARTKRALEQLEEANALQQQHGVSEARVVLREEIQVINPAIDDPSIIGGTFSPTDGFLSPMGIVEGYASASQRLGVRFAAEELPVNPFRTEGTRITGVNAPGGEIATSCVVNAAGAWAARVSNVSVTPLPRKVAATVPTTVLPDSMPMTIWVDDGFHLRVRDGRVLLLRPDPCASSFEPRVDESWLADVEQRAHERIPILRDIAIDRAACWAGLYEMSPDHHAILGPSDELENLYLANGSSGHGVMHAPAIGQLIAECIIDGHASSVDITPLRASRFREGKAIVAPSLL